MAWFKNDPLEIAKMNMVQLLPRDILVHAKSISPDEAEKQIMDAVKNHSLYSHSQNSNQWMNATAGTTMFYPTTTWSG